MQISHVLKTCLDPMPLHCQTISQFYTAFCKKVFVFIDRGEIVLSSLLISVVSELIHVSKSNFTVVYTVASMN